MVSVCARSRSCSVALLFALALCLGCCNAQKASADINAANQVPPLTEDAVNGATATFLLAMGASGEMGWEMRVKSIVNLTMAHIHVGNSTSSGNPVVILLPIGGVLSAAGPPVLPTPLTGDQTFIGNFTTASFVTSLAGASMDAFMTLLMDDQLYVNLHTTAYPDGAIRGQLMESSTPAPAPSSSPSPAPTPAPAPAPSAAIGGAALSKAAGLVLAALLVAFI